MTKFEVGKLFPIHNQAQAIEETKINTNEGFFDVCFYSLHVADDAKMFTKGKLKYGVFVKDHIPFFILDFVGGISVDASLNILKVKQDKVEAWLNSRANGITLYLIDAQTNILHGMRFIGIKNKVAEQIRDACEAQDANYATHSEVDVKSFEIANILTTEQMMKMITMYEL